MVATFTVFFEDPFWVGILESEHEGTLVVARHVFGSEPSNAELLDFLLYRFSDMRRSRPKPGEVPARVLVPMNPKRAQRAARKAQSRLPSTKSQSALSAALEEDKAERAVTSREERRAQAERRFSLRSEKKKRRHSGH
jgi:hypothetical protein